MPRARTPNPPSLIPAVWSTQGRKLSKIEFPCAISKNNFKAALPPQALTRQVLTVCCKPHKCEKNHAVPSHMNGKSPFRSNLFQISPSSRHTPGLEESRTCMVSSAGLNFGQGKILFLIISHPWWEAWNQGQQWEEERESLMVLVLGCCCAQENPSSVTNAKAAAPSERGAPRSSFRSRHMQGKPHWNVCKANSRQTNKVTKQRKVVYPKVASKQNYCPTTALHS